MILGLDVSTSCTGWCIMDSESKFIQMGYIELSKTNTMFEKANVVHIILEKLREEFDITDVSIEENLQAFRPGFSSAKTLMTLARFNGVVSYLCEQIFGLEPKFVNVNVARKKVGLKIIRRSKGGAPTKHQVLDWVTKQLKETDYTWPVKALKSGPRKGTVVFESGCYDMADAFVIATAAIEQGEQLS